MPEVSRFLGIVVRMYWDEHPPAHFHVEYGEAQAVFDIATLERVRGALPRRVQALVLQWAFEHRPELRANWERATAGEPIEPIAPLED